MRSYTFQAENNEDADPNVHLVLCIVICTFGINRAYRKEEQKFLTLSLLLQFHRKLMELINAFLKAWMLVYVV